MWHNLVNTRYFSEAAIAFKKNGGRYTTAPRGSRDYVEYWEEQERRCRVGYQVGDTWITGRHYFYLNFTVMQRTREGANSKTGQKVTDFPRFTEMQYEWWRFKHIAWNGGTFMGVKSPGGKHMCCGKTRRAGFSYMEAADGTYNYNFIDGSKSYYFASREDYLTKDGILVKVNDNIEWINQHSTRWLKNRHEKSTMMHQRATFKDEFGSIKGSRSEIMGVIVDDPHKTRGKSGMKITFEEAGSFKRLKEALEISMGSIIDGARFVGQVTVFGTGGEEGPSLEGLEDVFYDPHKWSMLEFPNIWESGETSYCGYFVPCYRANIDYIDADGNVDVAGAIAYDETQRDLKRNSKDPRDLDRRKAEFPQLPSEMFNRLSNNGFNIQAINRQIKRLETDSRLQNMLRYGWFEKDGGAEALGGVRFKPGLKRDLNPIEMYPHPQSDSFDLTGCVTIAEPPVVDQTGNVPEGVYFIVFDAYYKDESEDKTSLFDFRVFKQDNAFDPTFNRLPVAWYTGRPSRLAKVHEQLFLCAAYYNANIQGEIGGGGQGVKDYAMQKKLMHRLEFEPDMLHNKEIASNQRNRSYLMNMPTERKRLGMTYLEQWHMEERGLDADNNPIYNVDRIYDIGLLREMRKGGILNSDRMSSCIIAMFMLKEKVAKLIEDRQVQDSFYNRTLFSENNNTEEVVGLY